jgi:hypothetical protein
VSTPIQKQGVLGAYVLDQSLDAADSRFARRILEFSYGETVLLA